MVRFLLNFFLFMFHSVMDSYLKWGLNYCIPIYWSRRNFLYGFFTSIQRIFPRYIWYPLLWLNVIDCCSWFLLSCYYSWEVVIIVEWLLFLLKNILVFFSSLAYKCRKLGCMSKVWQNTRMNAEQRWWKWKYSNNQQSYMSICIIQLVLFYFYIYHKV